VGAGYGSAGERCMAISDEGFAAFQSATTPAPGPLQTHRNEVDKILPADDVEAIFLRLRDACV